MRRKSLSLLAALLIASLLTLSNPPAASGYTPKSPEVQAMVQRGIAFIEGRPQGGGMTGRLGGASLVGLTIYKHTKNHDHPLVKAAVAKCQKVANDGVTVMESIYDLGIALIFLGEVGPEEHRIEIEAILDILLKQQKGHGGFGYVTGVHSDTGDTSMTQYAVLGLWMADKQQIQVPGGAVQRVCNWLIRTQSIDGGWGYQGKDPGGFNRVKQNPVTRSLSAAGLSSVYVCADLLGLIDKDSKTSQLPPAIELVLSEEDRAKMREMSAEVSVQALMRAAKDGNNWFGKNYNIKADSEYQHYYMYALERYKSFQELVETPPGRKIPEDPQWYNDGVELLRESQDGNGSWRSCEAGPVIDTCFATLFLMRSTKNSISRIVFEQGRLTGGRGLSGDLSTARVDSRGKVVTSDATQAVADFIKLLDDPKAPKTEYNDLPEKFILSSDPKERSKELVRLRRMALNGKYEARMLAVKTIGTVRDLDSVPALIKALSDPDKRVAASARDALRFMSRKARGFGMPDKPTRPQYELAQTKWEDWYLSVRPDGELIQ